VQAVQQDVLLQAVAVEEATAMELLVETVELVAVAQALNGQQLHLLEPQTQVAAAVVQESVEAVAVHLRVVLADLVLLSFVMSMHL
jgi:hypothetical protein